MRGQDTVCPVCGCDRLKSRSHLLCRSHWRQVPAATQAEVLDSWADLKAAQKRRQARGVLMLALARYRAAREAAIASVTPVPSVTTPVLEAVS